MQAIKFVENKHLKKKPEDQTKLGFGKIFTDYMFTMEYNSKEGWHNAQVRPYENLSFDPATTFIHYGQAFFEGMKAYNAVDGVRLFRPRDNFARATRSAERLCMPALDEELALEGLKLLLKVEKDWIPTAPGTSLYIRPTMVATDVFLGVHASDSYLFFIILSPVGAYYAEGLKPVKIYVEDEYVRAARGGIGFTKAAANYAASIYAGELAAKKGYSQVLWLDAVERKYIEEVGAMNMFFVIDGTIVTPPLRGSILPGITRDSVIKLGRKMGYDVQERLISIDEVMETAHNGHMSEAFGSGTAAVISPVGAFCLEKDEVQVGDGGIGPISQKLYDTLTGIQYGRIQDEMGWSMKLDI